MTKKRVRALLRRVGADSAPFWHIRDPVAFRRAVAGLSDAQLLAALMRVERDRVAKLKDDQLLAELARLKEHLGHNQER